MKYTFDNDYKSAMIILENILKKSIQMKYLQKKTKNFWCYIPF